jgi:hypothetical protein
VTSPGFGLVSGRVSALALDPSDATGNHLYVGTTGGGVWESQNAGASNTSGIVFTSLTDTVPAMRTAQDASISIGAVTVQPGGTGVILAGTGDPNDALDSYYGAGILRSSDGGKSWSLISATEDQRWSFAGEGFAGFAWGTANSQLVVAAVSQAYEGTLVGAGQLGTSYQGLYYSSDAGVTWSLATITDGGGADVQGPNDLFAQPDGNAATSVVWNPLRQLFVAAVRFHGYYQSADGVTWTRMTAQPGSAMSAALCPTNSGSTGSPACPIFRGTLAVNPATGDTFAWTVDANNQDQGIWQDPCAANAGSCTGGSISFANQWATTPLQTSTYQGAATIANGDYNLALAAVPSGQDTLLLAGANDLWRCSLALGCAWRNTTNSATCMSAQVAPYQHVLAWNAANPLEILIGNDSGLWRSMDAIGETGQVCASTDASHFQNLNENLGSLVEVESLALAADTPYAVMTGLGVNGTAGMKGSSAPSGAWPQILGGEGGPVAIDPTNSANWYVNNQAGVSIHACSQTAACTPGAFGAAAAVTDADVGGDGLTMTTPAPFLVDPLDATQLLIGTCRVWRGPASGSGWNSGNAVSAILDGAKGNSACNGDALIRSMAAVKLANGGESVYIGMYGTADGGATLPGHVLSATINPASKSMPTWQDLTLNPVVNDSDAMNAHNLDISSIFIDPHDPTGNTVYVTVAGMQNLLEELQTVYRSTDGGAHWAFLTANLPEAPANSLVVDPQDANTVYIATDMGVYSTRQVANCAALSSTCWSAFGSGLPESPVVQLEAASTAASAHLLTAATYGRGVWQIPLWTASENLTTAAVAPASLTFGNQAYGTASSAQTVTLTNTGSAALMPAFVAASGDFSETDNCLNAIVNAGANCTIQVIFAPTQAGNQTGQLTIWANVAGGQLTAALSGTGVSAGTMTVTPAAVSFGSVEVGTTSPAMQVTAQNSGGLAVSYTTAISGPFAIASDACGGTAAADTACQLQLTFAPTQAGAATGTLTFTDSVGTQSVQLSGTGAAPPTDTLSPTSLTFPNTVDGLLSAAQVVSLTNSGDLALTGIAVTVSGAFQTSNNCTTQLTGNASCAISVVFAPTQAGVQSGTLTVSDALRTQTVALSGTGLLPPVLAVNPASLTFAPQQTGVASQPQTLTISNSGGAPMANVGFQITGQSAGSFSTGSTSCGAILNNGANCTVQVIFTPSASGGNAAALAVSSSTLGVTPVSVPLSGTGTVTTGLSVSPAQLAFAAVATGQSSAAQTVTISNTGNYAANSLMLTILPPFSLTQNGCGSSLAAGANCTTGVIFTPIATGAVSGSLTIDSPSLTVPAIVSLSGTGTSPAGVLVSPSSIAFGTTGVGQTSNATTVTITNPGTAASLSNLALAVTAGFQLANNTCSSTLAAQASCTAGVVFAPTVAGPLTGSLTVTSSASTTATSVALSGTGFDFAIAASGTSSQTIANGQTASYVLTITPSNGLAGAFTFACGTVPSYSACSFNPATESIAAGVTGSVTVQIATGQGARLESQPLGPGGRSVPLFCGLVLLPLAWRRRKALWLVVLLAIMVGGASGCSGSGGGGGGGGGGGTGSSHITPAGAYAIPVTMTSSGVQHSFTLTLVVD